MCVCNCIYIYIKPLKISQLDAWSSCSSLSCIFPIKIAMFGLPSCYLSWAQDIVQPSQAASVSRKNLMVFLYWTSFNWFGYAMHQSEYSKLVCFKAFPYWKRPKSQGLSLSLDFWWLSAGASWPRDVRPLKKLGATVGRHSLRRSQNCSVTSSREWSRTKPDFVNILHPCILIIL